MAANPNQEQTYIMIKPDGVQRGLVLHDSFHIFTAKVGEIIKRFEQKGFRLVALKLRQV